MPMLITPVIGAGLGAIGITGAGASILGNILTMGLGILIQKLLAPEQKQPKPEDGQVPIQQALSPRVFGVGTARVAGTVVLMEEQGGALLYVAACVGHEVSALRTYYLNDDVVRVGGTSGAVMTGKDGRYRSQCVHLDHRLGVARERPYSRVRSKVPTIWTESHRGDGIASLMMTCKQWHPKKQSKRYPYGQPKPSAVWDLAKVYDPRDRTQKYDKPSTWKFSTNPILQILWYECFCPYGPKHDYKTTIKPVVKQWIIEADICDELVPKKTGGTEKRYQAGGTFTTQMSPAEVRKALLATCDGWHVVRGDGTITVTVGKYREPVVILTDDDITGFTVQSEQEESARGDSMSAVYCSPDNGYSTVETDPVVLSNGDYALDQARKLQLDLKMVQTTGQASRLLRREVSRYNEPLRGQVHFRLSGINALYARWVRIKSNSIPFLSDVVIENRRPTLRIMDGACSIEFTRSGPQVDTYDADTMESRTPAIASRTKNDQIPVPENIAVIPILKGSAVVLSVSWGLPLVNNKPKRGLGYVVRYRATSGADRGWHPITLDADDIDLVAGRAFIETANVSRDTIYEVQIRATGDSGGENTDYSISEYADTSLVAPPAPLRIGARGGAGKITLTAQSPRSSIVTRIQFFRALAGDPFTAATAFGAPVPVASGQTATLVRACETGHYSWFAVAQTDDDISSPPVGQLKETVAGSTLARPTGFTASGGIECAKVIATIPGSASTAANGIQFWYAPAGNSFSTALPAGPAYGASRGDTVSATLQLDPGTWALWATTRGKERATSGATAVETVTVVPRTGKTKGLGKARDFAVAEAETVGNFEFEIVTPADSRITAVRIFAADDGDPFDSARQVGSSIAAKGGQTITTTLPLDVQYWRFWLVTEAYDGQQSEPVGPIEYDDED